MPVTNVQEAIPMLDLKAQYATIREEIAAAIQQVLDSQHFILGPQVKAFEEEMAAYCGARFAVGVASGTDALTLALYACGVGPGDEVIVPTFSYIATGDSASLLGAVPVFVDIDPATFNINPAQIEARITGKTKAIVPVHLYGQPADLDPILEIGRRRGIRIIEDSAQAIGATYHGRTTGSMGDIGCISFFPSKNLGGYGDGGMVVTNSEELAARLRTLRAHGTKRHKYMSDEQGWNSRLDELQAAILRVKLRHLDSWKRGRQSVAARYNELLAGVAGVVTPQVAAGCEHVYHQYTVRLPNRDAVQQRLADAGVPSTVYYPVPMHLQKMYAHLGGKLGMLPVAERAAEEVLSVPVYPELTAAQIHRVAEALAAAVRG
jgi:dTDP-4-amino-4,6-dideoxygalactose transaminase